MKSWMVYTCLIAEIDVDGETYMLNEGQWYKIDRDFLTLVNQSIRDLKPTNIRLPPFQDPSEAGYNERVAAQSRGSLVVMDRRFVNTTGLGPIEFCDLYSDSGVMVHVKRYSGSSTLSHLWGQGWVSSQLLLNDKAFRQELNLLLPKSHALDNPRNPVVPSAYEVAFAVVKNTKRAFVLPFFSKVQLRRVAEGIRQAGYRVTLTAIDNASS
jgi:uncharacterized protein (TIGR04141 family)